MLFAMEATIPFVGPTFNLVNNEFYPAVEETVLDPDAWNAVADDLANGLTAVVTRDGAGTMSGNLNMGSNKIVSLAAATNPGDAPRFDQIQPVDPTLTAWGALAFDGTNNLGYATGADTFALLATKAAGRSVLTLDDPNADRIVFWDDSEGSAAYLTVGAGLAISTTTIAVSANLQTYSGITPSANVQSFLGAADYSAMRTQLSLVPGTNFYSVSATDALLALKANKAGDTFTGTITSTAVTALSFQRSAHDTWEITQGTPSATRGIGLYNATDAAYGIFISDTENVGIGTTDPAARLDVVGGDTRIAAAPSALGVNSAGFRGLGTKTTRGGTGSFILANAGQLQFSSSGAPFTITIPANSSVAFPVDNTVIPIMNLSAGNITIAEDVGVTLTRLDGVVGSGSRVIPPRGFASIIKYDTNSWGICGIFS